MLLQDMFLIVIGRSCSCKVKTHKVLENLKRGIPYENASQVTFCCILNPGLSCAFLSSSFFFYLSVESGVIADGSIAGVLDGKKYNRAIRLHTFVYEALLRLVWSGFEAWLGDGDKNDRAG